MKTTGLVILFFLLSAIEPFLSDDAVIPSLIAGNKKIVFSIPVANATNTQKNQSQIDTTELKKGSWYSQVIKNIEESEYEIKYDELTHDYVSPNRQQNLKAFYTADQFTLLPRNDSVDKWKLILQLKGIYAGTGKLYSVANEPVVTQNGNSIQFNHSNQFITEYINSKEGVRQNFIIPRQPAGNPGKLNIQVGTNKGWYVNKVHDKELHFAKAEGDHLSNKITYNSLKVWDADNKELDTRFVINKNHTAFEIEVNTMDATYPVTIDPLSTTPAIALTGSDTNGHFGFSVASAGDVNGDGFSDVIVGAYQASNTGAAYIFFGSSTGLSASATPLLNALSTGDQFGFSVASAGDINGDGFSDVIVGAPGVSTNTGAAYLFTGSGTGLSAPAITILSGLNMPGDKFGLSVACAGDVNSDGFSDVVVGAPGVSTSTGAAYLFTGSGAGLSVSPATTLPGIATGDAFGTSVASAGNVNGDGFSDVIVGAPGVSANTGAAYLFTGSGTGLSAPAIPILSGLNAPGDKFGTSVASAGDVNGNGYSDVIVGAPGVSTSTGAAYLFTGSGAGLSASPATIPGIATGDAFGTSVACAGDINADGFSDVVAGAPGVTTNTGAAYFFIGGGAGLSDTTSMIRSGLNTGDQFGICVSSAGDVNGDGYSDVVAGADLVPSTGAAYTYHGSPDGLKAISNWQTTSLTEQLNGNYGISVASAGDVNSDGYSDVIIGADGIDMGYTDNGQAYLYLGSATGLSTTPAWVAAGSMVNEFFGHCVASAGDVNGDGFGDVLIGGYGYSSPEANEGRVYLYYGFAGGLSLAYDWSYQNNAANSKLGLSVASAGDVNGDGYSDIIIGAPQYNGGLVDEGIAYLFYGSSTVPAFTPDWSVEGNQTGALFGFSVAGLGDVNGDGFNDVIVGAYLYDNVSFTNEGAAFAYFGSRTGLSLIPDWTAESNQADAQFGICVAAAGDVNGDGFGDAIVGAVLYDDVLPNAGAAFVYYGSLLGLSPIADWTGENNRLATNFGRTVCSAGDVNGDGYSDVLIGASNYSNNELSEGALYAYYGSSTGLPLSSSLLVESDVSNIQLGGSVLSAGDVNGDGYSDVIAGAPFYTGISSFQGAAYVYYGNNNNGIRHNLRLYNSDMVTPIEHSSMVTALFGAGLFAKSPLGRQKGKLVWETEKNGQPFSGNPITNSTSFLLQDTLTDLGRNGFELKHKIGKEFDAKSTYLRVRVKYDLATAITGQVYGPWRYPESFLRGNRDIGAVALPVKFISFVALKQNDNVLLKWITADETPGIEYEVWHSPDGINFQTIKKITGNGSSRNEYEWVDNNASTGKNFYRIRAVENGKEAFSVIRQVNFDKINQVIIYPIPVKSGSDLSLKFADGPLSGILSVEIFSINGQKKAVYSIASGSNISKIRLPELTAGQYILKVINKKMTICSASFIVEK